VVAALVCGDQAERREHPCGRGNENGVHPELLGECACVQRPRASEGDEREIARVEPLLDGDDTERANHLGVDDFDHRGRIEISERSLRGTAVELDPARQPLGQASEEQVCVRDGRAAATLSVASRPGICAGALGPDPHGTAPVPDIGAAPGSDCARRASGATGNRR
jgi:hypothetical protein